MTDDGDAIRDIAIPEPRRPRPISIAPSILTADFGALREQVAEAEAGGAGRLHLDVMDGRFVPNISFGPIVISSLRHHSKLPFDAHLMIEDAGPYVEAFRSAGCDRIIVHIETSRHLHRLVEQIKHSGAEAGVAINPATPIIDLEEIAPFIDMVLVMSVNPGFGGQDFIQTTPRKIYRVKRLVERWQPNISIGVDGGVDDHTIASVVEAGADCIIAGSAVYNDRMSVADNIRKLRAAAASA